ncbi:MAG: SDR family oxidoreductase [Elusimicrobiales bacterium]
MAKIVIVGADGQVGKHLLRYYNTVSGVVAQGTCYIAQYPGLIPLDITKPRDVDKLISAQKPDTVILCSALTNVERCETHPQEAQAINVDAVHAVKNAADKNGAKLVFFSSEYVFDGKAGPYDELSAANPISVYGRTKLEGEAIAQSAKTGHLILRTTVVYSWDPGAFNFIMQLTGRLGRGEGMVVPVDQYSNPTYAPDLAEATAKLIASDKTGVFNAVGRDRLNRYEFALLACEVFGFNSSLLIKKTTAELGQKAARPLAAGLLTTKLERETGHRPLGAREGLLRIKQLREQSSAR